MSAIQNGFGPKGLIAGLAIGSIVFLPTVLVPEQKDLWSRSLLILATLVYAAFALLFERKKLHFTIIQLTVAVGLVALAIGLGSKQVVAVGLLGHALWDVWHVVSRQKYAPRWYAGACFYVDVGAATYLLFESN
jgi:threonine/homoserine efflux transporter RhtA